MVAEKIRGRASARLALLAMLAALVLFVVGMVSIAAVLYVRGTDLKGVCEDLQVLTAESNQRVGGTQDFIDANVRARRAAAELALREEQPALARLQFSIMREYVEVREDFRRLPPPDC